MMQLINALRYVYVFLFGTIVGGSIVLLVGMLVRIKK